MDSTDLQLLKTFSEQHDDAAFKALVQRHGPMVLAVCRRILSNAHDVDDAFQATFLVLARKAASMSLKPSLSLGGWLYKVSTHAALKLKAEAVKRSKHEQEIQAMNEPYNPPDPTWKQVTPFLDEELAKLPEKYRLPLVLCYLEDKTYAQVAAEIGSNHDKIKGLMERGRELLRIRLLRHGLTVSTAALPALMSQNASAAMSDPLVHSTVQMAEQLTAGKIAIGSIISTQVASLADGLMKTIMFQKLKMGAMAAIAVVAAAVGIGIAHWNYGDFYRLFQAKEKWGTFGLGTAFISIQPDGGIRPENLRLIVQSTKKRISVPLNKDGKFEFPMDEMLLMENPKISFDPACHGTVAVGFQYAEQDKGMGNDKTLPSSIRTLLASKGVEVDDRLFIADKSRHIERYKDLIAYPWALCQAFVITFSDALSNQSNFPKKVPAPIPFSFMVYTFKNPQTTSLIIHKASGDMVLPVHENGQCRVPFTELLFNENPKVDAPSAHFEIQWDPGMDPFIKPNGESILNKAEIAGNLRSVDGKEQATLTFRNQLSEEAHFYWIDYHGMPVYYKSLQPGESWVQQTFISHPWVVLDHNGSKLMQVVTKQKKEEFVLKK